MPAEPPYQDDPTISDDDVLLRRIPRNQYVVDPKSSDGIRPTSGAFDDSSDGSPMSMTLASECAGPPEALIADMVGAGVAAVCVELVRSLGQGVVRDPTPDDPGHVLVFGVKPKRSFGRRLAKESGWAVKPTP